MANAAIFSLKPITSRSNRVGVPSSTDDSLPVPATNKFCPGSWFYFSECGKWYNVIRSLFAWFVFNFRDELLVTGGAPSGDWIRRHCVGWIPFPLGVPSVEWLGSKDPMGVSNTEFGYSGWILRAHAYKLPGDWDPIFESTPPPYLKKIQNFYALKILQFQ